MTITEDFNAWWEELKGLNESNSAKARFQDLMIEIDNNLNELAQMNADGKFDELPASWKARALWAWQQLDTARDTIKADDDFMEGINWTPPAG